MKEFLSEWKSKILNWPFHKKKNKFYNLPKDISIELYDAKNINQLQWPDHSSALFSKQFFSSLIENGVDCYIDNLKTDLKLLKVQELILPIMINDNEYDNSYICSPYSFYISYALDSLNMVKSNQLRFMLKKMLYFLGKIFRQTKFDKVIHVNNLPFSANAYPSLDKATLAAIVLYLIDKFPEHAIIFRSLNYHSNAEECHSLKNIGASLIACRQVYLLDTKDPQNLSGKTFKRDLKNLKNMDYEIIETEQLKEEDFSTTAKLYEDIYINHHSKLNLKFNEQFMRLLAKDEFFHFKGLRKNDQIDGIFGYFCYNGIIFSSILGYNRNLPPDAHLYERLFTLFVLEGEKQDLLAYLGAGASEFKKNRKAKGHLEYMAVYNKHLPFNRRISWILLKSVIHSMGIYYMKKY